MRILFLIGTHISLKSWVTDWKSWISHSDLKLVCLQIDPCLPELAAFWELFWTGLLVWFDGVLEKKKKNCILTRSIFQIFYVKWFFCNLRTSWIFIISISDFSRFFCKNRANICLKETQKLFPDDLGMLNFV